MVFTLGPILLSAQPIPPARGYSFTDWQVNNPTAPPPGDKIDSEFDRTNQSVADTLEWAGTSLNTDGSLRDGSVGENQLVPGLFDDIASDAVAEVQPLVDQAHASAGAAAVSATSAQAAAVTAQTQAAVALNAATGAAGARTQAQSSATTALNAQNMAANSATAAGNSANHAAGDAALSQDYGLVTQAWAEHMPDTIPPNILAVQGVTGDHWSARWWANQAAQIVQGTLVIATGDTPPPHPLPGSLWFDSVSTQLYVWYTDPNSSQWVVANALGAGTASVVTLSDTPPANPQPGTFWFDSASAKLYLWYVDPTSSQWVIANGDGAPTPASAGVSTGDTPPVAPKPGALWFDSAGAQLYLWYADPSSSQWVVANGGTPTAGARRAAGDTIPIRHGAGPPPEDAIPEGFFSVWCDRNDGSLKLYARCDGLLRSLALT